MAQAHSSIDDFFSQLASLIEKTQQRGHGSVFLTQKRCTSTCKHFCASEEPQLTCDSDF